MFQLSAHSVLIFAHRVGPNHFCFFLSSFRDKLNLKNNFKVPKSQNQNVIISKWSLFNSIAKYWTRVGSKDYLYAIENSSISPNMISVQRNRCIFSCTWNKRIVEKVFKVWLKQFLIFLFCFSPSFLISLSFFSAYSFFSDTFEWNSSENRFTGILITFLLT